MILPVKYFLNNINIRKVYHFSSDKLSTQIPHYFICILCCTNDEKLILVCCTSDKNDKRKRRIEKLGLENTLIWIKPDDKNGFSKDTYVDCNTFFEYSVDEFKIMYQRNLIEYKGEISESHLKQIIKGMLESPDIQEYIKTKIKQHFTDILQ